MNGNTPYAGLPDVVEAGQRVAADSPSLSRAQRDALRDSASLIADQTRSYLTDGFVVGSEISLGVDGPLVTVAVHPPVGNPVSAGFEPSVGEADDSLIDAADREEVARGLAASAAHQVKLALDQSDVTPPAQ